MKKSEVILFLNEKLAELPEFRGLPSDSQSFPLWHKTISYVLEEVFGEESSEYQDFINASKIYGYIESSQREYIQKLENCETVVRSIIEKYEIVGFESESTVGNETEIKQSDKLSAIQMYDALDLHPTVRKVSRKLFKDGHYQDAIFRAFTEVNNFINLLLSTMLYQKHHHLILVGPATKPDSPQGSGHGRSKEG
ncbi:hypothetical protein ACFLVC_02685 [Chloroflexota bacterium]